MLSLLNNSFNSRPRLGIPLLGQGKLAFDQQGQDDSDPLAEHADQPIPSGAFRASLVNVGGRQMRHGLLGPLVVVALPAPCSIHIRRAYQAAAAAWGGRSVRIYQPSSCPSAQQANSVHAKRRSGLRGKATPRPCQAQPTRGTNCQNDWGRFQPSGRNLPSRVTRIIGCQPKATISWNSHRASRPRSVITVTVQVGSTWSANQRNNFSHSGFQE